MTKLFIRSIRDIRLNGIRGVDSVPPIFHSTFGLRDEITKIKVLALSRRTEVDINDKIELIAERCRYWNFRGRFAVNIYNDGGGFFGRLAGIRLDSDNLVCFYIPANCYGKDHLTVKLPDEIRRLRIKGIFVAKRQQWLESTASELNIRDQIDKIIEEKSGWENCIRPNLILKSEEKSNFGI